MRRFAVAVTFALSCAATMATPAGAAPFQFVFTDTIFGSTIPGISAGNQVTVTVTVDNGGNSLISQAWTAAQVVSAHLAAGTYSADYYPAFQEFPSTAFTTDGTGALLSVDFAGNTGPVNPSNADPFGSGGSVYLGNNGPSDFNGNSAPFSNSMNSNDRLWTGPFAGNGGQTGVPEPMSLGLLGMGLLGLGLARRHVRN